MKKLLTTLALFVMTVALLAQAPQKFSYQAVVRDAAGNLVRNAPVSVRVSIVKNSADGVAVYCETHRPTSNANGLLTLTIGDGTVVGGDMTTIDWADGPYFLKTETDITGGTNYNLLGSQQLLSVPYALYAGNVADGFSGDYNDLSNKPEIPVVPDKVSAFENDAHYLTNLELAEQLAKMQKQLDSLKQVVEEGGTSGGGSWGNDSLSTAKIEQLVLPIVNTLTVDSQSRYVDAELMFHGRSHITECGICYGFTSNPTLANEVIKSENKNIGEYICRMGYLNPDTEYYVRAYASNSDGTAYGTVIRFRTSIHGVDSFPCPGTPTLVDYDGNTYNTVQIGEQCWMKENLKTTKYADGTSISGGNTVSTTTALYYYPNGKSSNKEMYGLLYNWKATTKGLGSAGIPSGIQGVCPKGWHVPSEAEWTQLSDYVGSKKWYRSLTTNQYYIAKSLATTQGWNESTGDCVVGNDQERNNGTGFSAVQAGQYIWNGSYQFDRAVFWSTTDYDSYANNRYISYNSNEMGKNCYNDRGSGCSVRCLRN